MKHLLTLLLLFTSAMMLKAQQPDYNNTELVNLKKYKYPVRVDFWCNQDSLFPKFKLNNNSWKDNTFIAYDTSGNICGKTTATFDAINNTLVIIYKQMQKDNLPYIYTKTYTYDNKGNLISFKTEIFKNSICAKFLYNLTYDGNNNLLSDQQYIWKNNKWENQYRKDITYNADQKISNINWSWWINNQWDSSNVDIYSYDSLGNLTEILTKSHSNNQLEDHWKHTYTYDSIGQLKTDWYEIFHNSTWDRREYIEYSYDEKGNNTFTTHDLWYDNACFDRLTDSYVYDLNSNILSDTCNNWDFSFDSIPYITNTFLRTYTYNSNNNLLSMTICNGHNLAWSDIIRSTYSYDSLGNSLNGVSEKYINNKWIPEISSLRINNNGKISEDYIMGYRYEAIQTPTQQDNSNVFVYPNPSKGMFYLEINETFTTPYNLKIINSLNQIVYQAEVTDNKTLIYLPNLCPGMYFIHLTINGKAYLKKIIIQKNI